MVSQKPVPRLARVLLALQQMLLKGSYWIRLGRGRRGRMREEREEEPFGLEGLGEEAKGPVGDDAGVADITIEG